MKFSPEVYIVDQIIKPKENVDFANEEYVLRKLDGTLLKK